MAVSRMVLSGPRRSLPLRLAAGIIVVAAAGLLAWLLVPQAPAAHPVVSTSAAHAAAGPARIGTTGGATNARTAVPGAPAPPAADAAAANAVPASHGAPAFNAPAFNAPASHAAPAAGAGAGSRPIATIAPTSSDGLDGGAGPRSGPGPSQPICSVQKNCR